MYFFLEGVDWEEAEVGIRGVDGVDGVEVVCERDEG